MGRTGNGRGWARSVGEHGDRRRLPPDLRRKRYHGVVGWRFQLLLNQYLVHPRVLEGPGTVAGGDQRLHQSDGHPRVERVLGRQFPPPLGRFDRGAPLGAPLRQPVERGRVLARKLCPLLL